MFLEFKGLVGQGDWFEEREIITTLYQKRHTKLCVVIEPCGQYMCQDDTAVDLMLDFKLVKLTEALENIKFLPEDIVGELLMPVIEQVFQMEGLVVIQCYPVHEWLIKLLMDATKEYYFKNVKPDTHDKTHLIYVLPAERNH